MKWYRVLTIFIVTLLLTACDTHDKSSTKPKTCGTIVGLTCDAGEYCNLGTGQCGVADAGGICEEKPTICTKEYDPVCGCDGKTYGNACGAAAAGVSIDHPGACEQTCGGIVGEICNEQNQYCDLGEGQCQVADAQGTCKDKPEACPEVFDPVCGCDSKTYGNACEAAAAGVSIDTDGECE